MLKSKVGKAWRCCVREALVKISTSPKLLAVMAGRETRFVWVLLAFLPPASRPTPNTLSTTPFTTSHLSHSVPAAISTHDAAPYFSNFNSGQCCRARLVRPFAVHRVVRVRSATCNTLRPVLTRCPCIFFSVSRTTSFTSQFALSSSCTPSQGTLVRFPAPSRQHCFAVSHPR